MTLRAKFLLVVGLTFAGAALVTHLVTSRLLMQSFSALEGNMVRTNLSRADEALRSDFARMNATAGDWAPWDATRDFVLGLEPDFAENNLYPATLVNLQMHFMIFLDLELNLVHAFGADIETEADVPVAPEIIEYVRTHDLYEGPFSPTYYKAGIISLPAGLCIISAWPITNSEYAPPKHGYFVLGRYLSEVEIGNLSERTRLDISIMSPSDLEVGSPELQLFKALAVGEPPAVVPLDANTIAGYMVLTDLFDVPCALLRIDMPRAVRQHGEKTIGYFLLVLFVIGLLVLLALLISIEWVVLRPQRSLINEISLLAESRDLQLRLPQAKSDELERLSSAVNTMLASLEEVDQERRRAETRIKEAEKSESLKVFAGSIAHNFNNMLTTVLGNLELLRGVKCSEEDHEACLSAAETAARRAAKMSSLMRTYVGQGKDNICPTDLGALLRREAAAIESAVRPSVRLVLEIGQIPLVYGDSGQLQQVIINLYTNAIEALGETPGTIRVRARLETLSPTTLEEFSGAPNLEPGEHVCIEFSDSGIGMSEEALSRAFDPFFTTKFTGRGLGLAAVVGILRGHGGGIRLQSTPGAGTTATVLLRPAPGLPAADSADIVAEAQEPRPVVSETETASAKPPDRIRLLLVDDEVGTLNIGEKILRRAGFEVVTAVDGVEAVEAYRSHGHEIDCVLMDMSMPRMDGVTAFEAMQKMDPSVRVLIVTGLGVEDVAHRFSGDSFCGVVQKPYRLAEVVRSIRQAVAK